MGSYQYLFIVIIEMASGFGLPLCMIILFILGSCIFFKMHKICPLLCVVTYQWFQWGGYLLELGIWGASCAPSRGMAKSILNNTRVEPWDFIRTAYHQSPLLCHANISWFWKILMISLDRNRVGVQPLSTLADAIMSRPYFSRVELWYNGLWL